MDTSEMLYKVLPEASAELVELTCPEGHVFNYIGNDPLDRETYVSCPECKAHAAEYGGWVTRTIAFMTGNKIVFARAEDVSKFKIEVLSEGGSKTE